MIARITRKKIAIMILLFVVILILAFFAFYKKGVFQGEWAWVRPTVYLNFGKQNNMFYIGEPVSFTISKEGATTYEIRNYLGDIVESGNVVAQNNTYKVDTGITEPGWYKVYLYGNFNKEVMGNIAGGDTFVIVRNNSNFPARPTDGTKAQYYDATKDNIMRGLIAVGPFRHAIRQDKITDPAAAIAYLQPDIDQDLQYYMAYDDGQRPRKLMIAFPDGTKGYESNITQIATHFKDNVKYWEPRNEPYGDGAKYATEELCPFYNAVKAADPSLKILGPGTVSIQAGDLSFIQAVFNAGGNKCIDGLSFHAYNVVNGDLALARRELNDLKELLKKNNLENIEIWQTEQGYAAPIYGAYEPRHQGHWIMMHKMVFEQYGIPKEQDHYWYDKSHGFWDFPMFLVGGDNGDSPEPGFILIRNWSEELYGTKYVSAYDFGSVDNKFFIASLFEGPNKKVAAFMNNNLAPTKIKLSVSSGETLKIVSAMGKESQISVTNHVAELEVPELPVYVELSSNQTISVIKRDLGENLTQMLGTKVFASTEAGDPDNPQTDNSVNKIINNFEESDRHNNEYEKYHKVTWEYGKPWMSRNVNTAETSRDFPMTVEIDLPTVMDINKVNVLASPPWQWVGSLLDYDLQYEKDGQWITLETVQEPTKTWNVYTPLTVSATTVDSFYSERWIFLHEFKTVRASKIRLYIRDATWGGGATQAVAKAGGQTGPHWVTLREIEIFGPTDSNQKFSLNGSIKDNNGNPLNSINVTKNDAVNSLIQTIKDKNNNFVTIPKTQSPTLSTTTTAANGSFLFNDIYSGQSVTITPMSLDYDFNPPSITLTQMTSNFTNANFVATPKIEGIGLRAEYYNSQYDPSHAFSHDYFKVSSIDSTININDGKKTPLGQDINFSVRWTGYIKAPQTGDYTFFVDKSDDLLNLDVNNTRLISYWDGVSMRGTVTPYNGSATIHLEANKAVPIKLDMWHLHGTAVFKMSWQGPGIEQKTVVDKKYLYPEQCNSPTLLNIFNNLNMTIYNRDVIKTAINYLSSNIDKAMVSSINLTDVNGNAVAAKQDGNSAIFISDQNEIATGQKIFYVKATNPNTKAITYSQPVTIKIVPLPNDIKTLDQTAFVEGVNMVSFPAIVENYFSDFLYIPEQYNPDIDTKIQTASGTGRAKLYMYNLNQYLRYSIADQTFQPQNGRGYFMRITAGDNISQLAFMFKDVNKEISVDINKGWNLLGNPYLSAISPNKNIEILLTNGQKISLNDAVGQKKILDYFYSWDRSKQVYQFISENMKYNNQPNYTNSIGVFRGFWFYVKTDDVKSVIFKP